MTRRYALAAALAITTIITFMLVAMGTRAGMFGGGGGGDAAQAVATASPEELAGALRYLAAQQASPAAAQVAQVMADPQVFTEYVYVYETVTPPNAPPASAATPAPSPVGAAPAVPTEPAMPEASATRAASPTPVPLAPTAPPASAPTTAPPGPSELEFTGTVTAISGDQVTWSYGGGSLTTRVVQGLDQLQAGTVAKVHALWVGSGYVAKEIELKG